MQLCVRFGIDNDLDPFLEEVNDFKVPPCFDQDREQLVLLSKFGIGWWDETHKQFCIGILGRVKLSNVDLHKTRMEITMRIVLTVMGRLPFK
jgi:hypothetical protein